MDFPETTGQYGGQGPDGPGGGGPANELEEVLIASLGSTSAGGRIVEVLGRSPLWIPLPNGGGPDSGPLDLPTTEIDGQAYVPVFSSEQQFRRGAGAMSFAVAPAVEFARGLPPQLGIVVNPGAAVVVPLPPPAVAVLCKAGHTPLDGPATGGRVRLFEPDWQDEPVDFLAAAAGEFQQSGTVVTARRALASVEGGPDELFIGVQVSSWEGADRNAPMDALGRALGREPVRWPVHLLLLDMAQDPVAEWMLERVRPFYRREH
ncbi:enhanced serine sensitivity protein SseB [Streptomyces sp. NPDC051561]|uniref:enhanced serine sensitivity protein SseB n=1 Tax=Streptomyces sp. NPDC051561 TaxID=3365658 RepID=UPI003792DBA8